MTPINATASVPPASPGFDPGAAARAARQTAPTGETGESAATERSFWDRLWGKEGFSFGALLDIVNPLQHIPIVSTIYRAATGDTIGPAPRVMGGAIFGGVIGLIASAADAALEGITGKDTGSHVMAMLPEPDPPSQWAYGDEPRHRALMTAVMNLPDGPTTQFAASDVIDSAASRETAAPTAMSAATPPDSSSAAKVADAAASVIPASAPAAGQPSAHPLAAAPRTAQLGAGGRLVPMASNGRPGTQLPSPKELAANPALLQELRQGGASAANAAQKNTGRIDTAIKGRGLVSPTPTDASPIQLPPGSPMPKPSDVRGMASGTPTNAETGKAAPRGDAAIPEVGPDFLMKMQQALDKYQALRAAPTLDVAH